MIASMVGLDSRATMDMDATIKGYPVDGNTVRKMIEDVIGSMQPLETYGMQMRMH